MRGIKVRGFAVEKLCSTSQWVEGFGVLSSELTNGETDYILFTPYGNYEVCGKSVGQYTGLKDKNGKEIYEGDIIVYEIDNGVGIESYCARVFWSENEEGYKNRFEWLIAYLDTNGFDALSRPATYNEALEVIGNIYENADLFMS